MSAVYRSARSTSESRKAQCYMQFQFGRVCSQVARVEAIQQLEGTDGDAVRKITVQPNSSGNGICSHGRAVTSVFAKVLCCCERRGAVEVLVGENASEQQFRLGAGVPLRGIFDQFQYLFQSVDRVADHSCGLENLGAVQVTDCPVRGREMAQRLSSRVHSIERTREVTGQ